MKIYSPGGEPGIFAACYVDVEIGGTCLWDSIRAGGAEGSNVARYQCYSSDSKTRRYW